MKDAGSRRSGFGSVVCTQQASRGHLGNIQGPWGKVTLDPGKGKGSGQRALQGHDGRGKSRSSHVTKVFHCTHIVSTPSVSQLHQPSAKWFQPPTPSEEATPRLKDKASWEGSRLRRSLPLPHKGPAFHLGHPVYPKASFKGPASPPDKWSLDYT